MPTPAEIGAAIEALGVTDSLKRSENPLASAGWEVANDFGAENIGQATSTGWTGTTASKDAGAKRKTWVTGQTGCVAITLPVLPSEAQVINLGFVYGPTCYLYVYGDNEHTFCGISVHGQKAVTGEEGEHALKPGDRLAMWYSRTECKLLRKPSGGAWEQMLSLTTTINMSPRRPYFIVYPEGKAGLLYRFTEFVSGSLDAAGTVLWGALPAGTVYAKEQGNAPYNASTYNEYEEHAGRSLGIVHWAQPWIEWNGFGEGGPQVDERGSLSMINMDAPPSSEGKTGMERVLAGTFDAAIKTWAEAAAAFARPFFFRPWREMNGTWYSWGRDPHYNEAWRHMWSLITAIAPNVTFFWCPNTVYTSEDPESGELSKWYPGNAYVDWIGMDGYNYGTNPIQPGGWKTPKQVFLQTYEILQTISTTKPMMIGEVGCTEIGGEKGPWITTLYGTTLPELTQIKAVAWFNDNVNDGAGEWDWQIESSAAAQKAFFEAIKNTRYSGAISSAAPSNALVPGTPARTAESTATEHFPLSKLNPLVAF